MSSSLCVESSSGSKPNIGSFSSFVDESVISSSVIVVSSLSSGVESTGSSINVPSIVVVSCSGVSSVIGNKESLLSATDATSMLCVSGSSEIAFTIAL